MDDIEWACKWVGLSYWGADAHKAREGYYDTSILLLAEAVRIKCQPLIKEQGSSYEHVNLAESWLDDGPLAFIATARWLFSDVPDTPPTLWMLDD